jgi:hypothetical protein
MPPISVPRPPKSAFDPNRPVSALLKAQIEYLHVAERRLPLRYHSEIYINAIKSEGEAAEYIRAVTEAIHQAHADAAVRRARPAKRRGGIGTAAGADERAARRRPSKSKSKSKNKNNAKTRGAPTKAKNGRSPGAKK